MKTKPAGPTIKAMGFETHFASMTPLMIPVEFSIRYGGTVTLTSNRGSPATQTSRTCISLSDLGKLSAQTEMSFREGEGKWLRGSHPDIHRLKVSHSGGPGFDPSWLDHTDR